MTARAPKGLRFFHVRSDAVIYLSLLTDVTRRPRLVRADVLPDANHVHFLIMTPEANLSDGMKVLHERFVPLMHERRETHGHLLGDRYKNHARTQQKPRDRLLSLHRPEPGQGGPMRHALEPGSGARIER